MSEATALAADSHLRERVKRGKNDPISILDCGAVTIDKGTVEPFANHFMEGFKDVGHQNSDAQVTADDL